ncbi:hypothetical protein ACX0HA_12490 [Flavobacterium hauense]
MKLVRKMFILGIKVTIQLYILDEVIGTTSKGKSTKTLQVYLDSKGNVINSYQNLNR